jgi:ribosomal protein S12 methylthiotransferase
MLDAVDVAHAHGARVAAVGCLVERYRDDLAAEMPEVDLWCGLDTAPLLAALAGGEEGDADTPAGHGGRSLPVPHRLRPVSAYVKISDGCDRRCSFCPSLTGCGLSARTSRSPTAATAAAPSAPSR